MTQDGAESGARTRIEASEVGGRWYVRYVDTQFWGDGESLSAAHEDLRRREADYKAYLENAMRDAGCVIGRVAAEELVAAFAAQDDGYMPPDVTAKLEKREAARI